MKYLNDFRMFDITLDEKIYKNTDTLQLLIKVKIMISNWLTIIYNPLKLILNKS